jgi:hypothetical protein
MEDNPIQRRAMPIILCSYAHAARQKIHFPCTIPEMTTDTVVFSPDLIPLIREGIKDLADAMRQLAQANQHVPSVIEHKVTFDTPVLILLSAFIVVSLVAIWKWTK